MILVLSPHNDDETLFAAFTVIKHQAHVVVAHGSGGDYGRSEERLQESAQAVAILGGTTEQWDVPSGDATLLHAKLVALRDLRSPIARVFAPDVHASHADHRALGEAALDVFRGKLTTYHTYVDGRRVTPMAAGYGRAVEVEHPSWVHRKLRALSCYATQATHARASQFFLQDQREYYGRDL